MATLAIGAGTRESATEGIRELGANLLFVRPGKARVGYAWLGNVETLTLEDAESVGKIRGWPPPFRKFSPASRSNTGIGTATAGSSG